MGFYGPLCLSWPVSSTGLCFSLNRAAACLLIDYWVVLILGSRDTRDTMSHRSQAKSHVFLFTLPQLHIIIGLWRSFKDSTLFSMSLARGATRAQDKRWLSFGHFCHKHKGCWSYYHNGDLLTWSKANDFSVEYGTSLQNNQWWGLAFRNTLSVWYNSKGIFKITN